MGVGRGTTGRTYSSSEIPGTLEGIREYYVERGYQENPQLELKEEGQLTSFVLPIPGKTGQSRRHIRVKRDGAHYIVVSHIDKYDPEQNQLGHLNDIIDPPRHRMIRVKRTD